MKHIYIVVLALAASAAMGAAAPSVGAGFTPATPTTNDTVSFYCTVTGTGPFTYAWTGSDGVTGTLQSTTHKYSTAGRYTANVTVTDSAGQSSTASVTIDVQAADGGGGGGDNPLPIPTPSARPVITRLLLPSEVRVDVPAAWELDWNSVAPSATQVDWGDGVWADPISPGPGLAIFSHTFVTPTMHTIKFKVTGPGGEVVQELSFQVLEKREGIWLNIKPGKFISTGHKRVELIGLTITGDTGGSDTIGIKLNQRKWPGTNGAKIVNLRAWAKNRP